MIKMVLSVLGLVAAGGIFFAYTQPHYDDIRATKAQIAEYDQALDRAAELQNLKQSLLSRYNAFNPANLERLQKLLPDHVDNVRLVLDLDRLASQHGMALQNVVISNPASEAGQQSTVGNVITASKQKYDSLTLEFSTLGSYQSFKAFLQDLEASLRIVDLVSLKLQPGGSSAQPGQTQAEPAYQYDVTIRTYWLK